MSMMPLTLAGLALLLAMVGLYRILATTAIARSRQMAIRAAIGARPGSLFRLALGHAFIAAGPRRPCCSCP
jgi:ABC-type antimicrobial peptide transport system permease subunit